MKKVILILLILILTVLISFKIKKGREEKNIQIRYQEIKENVKKAVIWNISAQYPKCTIDDNFLDSDKDASGTSYNSSFLISNGYIKKEELLDIDKTSYCDVYVKIKVYYDNPLDHQQDCIANYKIYLKCQKYKDKGYINWNK